MDKGKIRDNVVKMVDGLINEVLDERKSEFDVIRAVVKKKKKDYQKQKKMIDVKNYSVKSITEKPVIVKAVNVTPKGPFEESDIIDGAFEENYRRKKRKKH